MYQSKTVFHFSLTQSFVRLVEIRLGISANTYSVVFQESIIGGTAWESNPPDLARRSQAVLKTVEDTSTPFSPMDVNIS